MKKGSLYITDRRIILEGERGGLGQFRSQTASGDTLTDTLRVTVAKDIIIPLESISDMKRAKFFLTRNVIRVKGEGMSEEGWRIVFQSDFLKAVQLFIDMQKWNDETPALLKISRHLA